MNIYDVSRKAGVSIATVSRVLNGSPNVSERTRTLVLEIMEQLGYTPNVFARGLGLGSIQTIGIMCSDSSDPYLSHAIYYLEQGLRGFGYDSILCCTGSSLETKQKYFDLLRSKKVDAMILAGSKFVENRPEDAWGAITVWAWAASRIMDYFETEPLIDEKRVAVAGHSRGGKTALWCTAQDERFAMAVSSCAGNSGDAISRGSKGETVRDIADRFPYWFCRNYQKYKNNEEALPFDQHMLLALIAPRLVYTTSKTFDSWADPEGQFESCVQADPVYRLLGVKGMEERQKPLPEHPIHEGHIGHHHKTGNHDLDEYDWNCFMDFADRHM